MKNIIKLLALLSLCALLSITIFATSNYDDTFTNQNHDITVIFPEDTSFTKAEQERIATYLLTGEQPTSKGLWCDLFGHSMSYTGGGVITVSHYIRTTSPRCLEQTYAIYSCSTCGEVSSRLIGSGAKSCH